MNRYQKLVVSGVVLLPMIYGSVSYAAKPVNLRHEQVSILQSMLAATPTTALTGGINLKEISRSVDFNKTLHVRIQETYLGYPVWGGDFIMHIPNGNNVSKTLGSALTVAKNTNTSMNGIIYQNLNVDLANTPSVVFDSQQAQKALQQAIDTYQHKAGLKSEVKNSQSRLIVFVDKNHKAHWAYQVNFYVESPKAGVMPAKPVYIMDAINFKIYKHWDDVKTELKEVTFGGGFGGNEKIGKVVYDGLPGNLTKLNILRDGALCFLKNDDVTVKSYRTRHVETFPCLTQDNDHKVYWDGEFHAVNGGYSPDNDALFGGAVIKGLYQDWYGVPVLTDGGKPMMLNMVVHANIDNAYWDGSQMTFGDGEVTFYPLTSIGVAGHEISHGFTEQHSELVYDEQSGGMNEAFSDMAAKAVEVYAYGAVKNWDIAGEIFKAENEALRYMDQPSKDCGGRDPGNWCSIDVASQYYDGLDVHYSSGVYNRAFYLLSTAAGWDAKKAFDVMVHANMHYWTSNSTFEEGACGALKAAKDLGYELTAVTNAFKTVEVDTSAC